jgi:hypothetical protein
LTESKFCGGTTLKAHRRDFVDAGARLYASAEEEAKGQRFPGVGHKTLLTLVRT